MAPHWQRDLRRDHASPHRRGAIGSPDRSRQPFRSKSSDELSAPPRHEGFYGQPLSDAELRVLALLAAGRSVSEVARELYLTPNTVKTHRRTIYRKLGVTNRQDAIARAVELSLV
jgi:LuxR family maltose regulon positive regulatory protein